MKIKWNIVNRTGEASDTIAPKLRPKITKLEKLLTHFPQDTVHLQIILDARPHDKTYQVRLNLRVPSDVLHVASESHSLVGAFGEAVRMLVRRLKRLKARYRRDHEWKHRSGKPMPEQAVAFAEAPLPNEEGPQTQVDTIVEVLKEDYGRLLGFVARQINEHVLSGSVPKGAIEPHDVVDGVAELVLHFPERKPESMDYRTWCSSLAFQQTRDAVQSCAEKMTTQVSVDLDVEPGSPSAGEDDMEPEEFALNLLQRQLEPDEQTLADTIPDTHIDSPYSYVAKEDLLSNLAELSRQWPKADREIFQLHFMEGLSIDDVAHAFSDNRESVEASVSSLRARLRTVLADLVGIDGIVAPSPNQLGAYATHLRRVNDDVAGGKPEGEL